MPRSKPQDTTHEGEPLTTAERKFVDEYLVHLNATRAYMAVHPDVSYAAARMAASRLVAKDNVRAEIAAARKVWRRRSQTDAREALKQLARLVNYDPIDLFDARTELLRHPRQIAFDTRQAISSVSVARVRTTRRVTKEGKTRTTTTTTESVLTYKLHSKLDAIRSLLNFLGFEKMPPLDVVLAVMPPDLARQLRQALLEDRRANPGHPS